jgi:hypothetical protein
VPGVLIAAILVSDQIGDGLVIRVPVAFELANAAPQAGDFLFEILKCTHAILLRCRMQVCSSLPKLRAIPDEFDALCRLDHAAHMGTQGAEPLYCFGDYLLLRLREPNQAAFGDR